MKTVQLGYQLHTETAERVLVASTGEVFSEGRWTQPTGAVVPLARSFDRWCDVPAAWLGGCPWWR